MRNQIKIVMGNKPSVAELKNSLDNQYKVLLWNKVATRFFASVAIASAILCVDHSVKHNECMDKYNTLLQNYKQTSQFINTQLVDMHAEYQKACVDEWYEYSDVHSDEYAERVRLEHLNSEDRQAQEMEKAEGKQHGEDADTNAFISSFAIGATALSYGLYKGRQDKYNRDREKLVDLVCEMSHDNFEDFIK